MPSNNISPAWLTPPPITKTSGSQTHAIFDNARPNILLNLSTISLANLSSSLAASNISLAVTSSTDLNLESSFSFCNNSLAILTIPVADAYCSKHPFLLQLHAVFSWGFTFICPISPPAPFAPVRIYILSIEQIK